MGKKTTIILAVVLLLVFLAAAFLHTASGGVSVHTERTVPYSEILTGNDRTG